MHAKLLQSCPTLWDPVDCSLPGSSVHMILQARILECVVKSSSKQPFWSRDWTYLSCGPCIAGGFFTAEPLGKLILCMHKLAAKSLQSSPTLRPHRRQPTRLPRPWDSPGKNTGVGCHFLLQCTSLKPELNSGYQKLQSHPIFATNKLLNLFKIKKVLFQQPVL